MTIQWHTYLNLKVTLYRKRGYGMHSNTSYIVVIKILIEQKQKNNVLSDPCEIIMHLFNIAVIKKKRKIQCTYGVFGKKRNTLSNRLVDHVGLTHIFYLHLLKTFRFIPDTLCTLFQKNVKARIIFIFLEPRHKVGKARTSRRKCKGRIYFLLIMYNDGVIYTRWRPPQQRVARLGGGHCLGCGLN